MENRRPGDQALSLDEVGHLALPLLVCRRRCAVRGLISSILCGVNPQPPWHGGLGHCAATFGFDETDVIIGSEAPNSLNLVVVARRIKD